MPRLAANLTMLFADEPLPERLERVRAAGFRGIEILFPYDWTAAELKTWVRAADVQLVLINTPPGDWSSGERGLAAQPGRQADFRSAFGQALDYATQLACHVSMSWLGFGPSNGKPATPALSTICVMRLKRPVDSTSTF